MNGKMINRKMVKRIVSVTLALALMLTLVPLQDVRVQADTETITVSVSGTKITLTGSGDLSSTAPTNYNPTPSLMGSSELTVSGLLAYFKSTNITIVLNGFSSIAASVFENYTNIIGVTFSESLQYIYSDAFYGCTGLTSVVFPSNLYQIDTEAFYDCSNLSSVEFTNKTAIPSIDNRSFTHVASSGTRTLIIPYELSVDSSFTTKIGNTGLKDWTQVVKATVSFTENGGSWASGYTKPTGYTQGTELTLPTSSNISKTGYNFDGWYTDASFNGSAVTSISTEDEGNKAYYAKWTEKTATLSFDANGSSTTAPADITMKYTEVTTLPAAITRSGYIFAGWNTLADGTGTNYSAGAAYKAANVEPSAGTLYAKWTAKEIPTASDITYNSTSETLTAATGKDLGTLTTYYKVNDTWQTTKPTTPGTYAMGVVTTESDTYLAGGTATAPITDSTWVYHVATGATITTQPADTTVTEGSDATFTIVATASDGGTLSYQWQKQAGGTGAWDNVSGATSASYTVSSTTRAMNGDKYRCVITNTLANGDTSNSTSDEATLTVKYAPTTSDFTFTAPSSLTYDATGKNATVTAITATAAEMGTITIKYKKDAGGIWTTDVPVSAGTYYVAIDVAGGTKYQAATELADSTNWTFTIAKATPQASDFVYTAPVNYCLGDEIPDTILKKKDSIVGMKTGTTAYTQDGTTWTTGAPHSSGTWQVGILVTGGTNYKTTYGTAPNYLTDSSWTFTITAAYDIALDVNGGTSTVGTIPYITITGTGTLAGCDLTPTEYTRCAYKEAGVVTYTYNGTRWGDQAEGVSYFATGYTGTPETGDTFTITTEMVQGERVLPGNSITATATREGYTFDGWYTAADGGTKVTTPTASQKLYAHWIKNASSSASTSVSVTVTSNTSGNVKVPEDKQNSNYGGGKIGESTEDVKKAVLTDTDKSALAAGKDINIWVETKDASATVSTADKKIVKNQLPKNYVVGEYLDVNLWKQVSGSEAVKVTEVPNGKITITIKVPTELQKKGRAYKIIRVHDGVASVLPASVNENYELTFETDRFSTYAITYTDATGNKKSPQTGDSNLGWMWILLMAAGLGIFGVEMIGMTKRRRYE